MQWPWDEPIRGTAMKRAEELLERDIGKMVIRIDSLIAQLEEVLDENQKLKDRLNQLTTEVHPNGA